MTRPVTTWLVFALCLGGLFAVMGWVSHTAVTLDQRQVEAEYRAVVEEQVRLALWRLDSALTPLIARESAHPHRAFLEGAGPADPAAEASGEVRLHFLVDEEGSITSPDGAAMETLTEFRERLGREELLAALPDGPMYESEPLAMVVKVPAPAPTKRPKTRAAKQKKETLLAMNEPVAPAQQFEKGPVAQQKKGQIEWNKRATNVQRSVGNYFNPSNSVGNISGGSLGGLGTGRGTGLSGLGYEQQATDQDAIAIPQVAYGGEGEPVDIQSLIEANEAGADPHTDANAAGEQRRRPQNRTRTHLAPVREGLMQPVWVGDLLLLARRTTVDGATYLEGSWLDWPVIETALLDEISDLLPAARLEPVRAEGLADPERLLATLPVRLAPGALTPPPAPTWTPLKISLAIAWACVLLAAAAVFGLLLGAMSLSERRGAFVSAVTHELRTPLTTFRMYTEMLTEGMVEGEEKKDRYLRTLRREADRLGGLVENVLSYARIEGNRYARRIEEVPLAQLVEASIGRLRERAAQAQMSLEVDIAEDAGGTAVKVDPGAADQVLFNLIDNAAKYAASADDRRIHLEAELGPKTVIVRVRDHGPGVPAGEERRVFHPFSKSSEHAAGTAPGVGLGLALSRRLARHMGGDLALERASEGAAFVLTLPRA